MVNMQGTGQGSFLPGLGLQTQTFRVLQPTRKSSCHNTDLFRYEKVLLGFFWEWEYVLRLKDSPGTPTPFSEAELAVAMKKATLLLCLSPCGVRPSASLPKHPLLKQSLLPLPQPDCPQLCLGHPCEKPLQESCCVCGFYYPYSWRTNTFNI